MEGVGGGGRGERHGSSLAPGLTPPIRLTATLGLPRSGDTETSGRGVSPEVIPSRWDG